jgi:hypothetical protein
VDVGVLVRYRCVHTVGVTYQIVLTTEASTDLDAICCTTLAEAMLGDVCVYRSPGLGLRKDGGRKEGERVGVAELALEFPDHGVVSRGTIAEVVLTIIKAADVRAVDRPAVATTDGGWGRHGRSAARSRAPFDGLPAGERSGEAAVASSPWAHALRHDGHHALHDDGLAIVFSWVPHLKTLVACSGVCRRWRDMLRWAVRTLSLDHLRLYKVPRRRTGGLLKPQTQLVASRNTKAAFQWIGDRLVGLEVLLVHDLNGATADALAVVCQSYIHLRSIVLDQPRFESAAREVEAEAIVKRVQCIEQLPDCLSTLSRLVHLDLSNQGIRRLPGRLDLQFLEHLDLFGNLLGVDGGAADFAIVGCPRLRKLCVPVLSHRPHFPHPYAQSLFP